MNRNNFHRLLFLFLSITAAAAAGAADQDDASSALVDRVNEYWEALRLGDFTTVYRYQSAAQEGRLDPMRARQLIPDSTLLSYTVTNTTIDGADAEVTVTGEYRLPQLKSSFKATKKGQWTLIDGQWYKQTPERFLSGR